MRIMEAEHSPAKFHCGNPFCSGPQDDPQQFRVRKTPGPAGKKTFIRLLFDLLHLYLPKPLRASEADMHYIFSSAQPAQTSVKQILKRFKDPEFGVRPCQSALEIDVVGRFDGAVSAQLN
jgi:hypothetical protein